MIISSLPFTPHPTFSPPTPLFTDLHGAKNVLSTRLLGRDRVECTDISRCRTTTNIVLSCLTTIFACTWVALHLDVSKHNQPLWKTFWRRFRWMIVALIAPEYISGIAIRERVVAKKYVDEWNVNFVSLCSPELVEIQGKSAKQYEHELKDKKHDSRWTLTHGFLAGMGGIRLYNDGLDEPVEFEPDSKFFEDPKMRPIIQQIGLISSEDIEDKSKGDWISKLFIIMQTIWFIVQCVARWAAHLPVTELEVVTLAYAVQNILIYALWWNKPQSLSVPYRFYLEIDEEISENIDVEDDRKQEEVPFTPRSPSPSIANKPPNINSISKSNTRLQRSRKRSLLMNQWVEPTHSGVQGFFMRIFGGDGYWLIFLLAGAIFGGLHLIPIWLSVFPSNAENILWQVSAFYVTAAPVAGGLLAWGAEVVSSNRILLNIFGAFAACVCVIYPVARVILLVLPFTTLRSLPLEALLNVEWTRFIPHF